MKCNRCGHEQEFDFIFCPICGFETPTAPLYDEQNTRVSSNPAFHHLSNAFKDTLFLVFCILMTASCGISLIGGESFDIINILLTIFSWLAFTSAKSGTLDSSKIKNISGTIYAYYIISYVASIILIICSFMLVLSGGLIYSSVSPAEVEAIAEEVYPRYPFLSYDPTDYADIFMILAIVMGAFSIILLILTIFGTRYIHKFVKSTYQSMDAGCISYEAASAAANWLIAFGVIHILSTFSIFTLPALSANVLYATALIVAGVFVNKHFTNISKV